MVGTTLGNYKILEKIGAGGQGTVYRAVDSKLGRTVVIKVLPAELTTREANLKRFEREARLASALDHPNICTIFDLNEVNGIHYIAMQFVEGRNVRQLVNGTPLALESALSIAIQVADALAVAHSSGIVHRDIKAGNVMVTPKGQVKVLDFGLAKLLDEDAARTSGIHHTELTEVGVPYGTATYAAPEQARGDRVDSRADIFSAGVLLYEMLTGSWPFRGKTAIDVRHAVLHEQPVPVADARRSPVPPRLKEILDKALAKNPRERYQDVTQFRDDLREVLSEQQSPSAVPEPHQVPIPPRHIRSQGPVSRALQWLKNVAAVDETQGIFARKASGSPTHETPTSMADKEKKSVAILPFKNVGRDEETAFYEFSLADAVITELARVRSLIVRASSVIVKYQGKQINPAEAGRELGVDAILASSFLRSGDRLRVTAQLLDVKNSEILWSDRLDADASDIITVQDSIVTHIVEALRLELSPDEQQQLAKGSTADGAASEAYLRGRHCLGRFIYHTIAREDVDAAIRYFQQAVELDPTFALAYSALGSCYINRVIKGLAESGDHSRAKEAFNRALAIDPGLLEARMHMVFIYLTSGNKERAREEVERLRQEYPNDVGVHFVRGVLARLDSQYDRALRSYDRMVKLNPAEAVVASYNRARIFMYQQRYEEASRELDKGAAVEPEHPLVKAFRARVLYYQGEIEAATSLLQDVLDRQPDIDGIRPILALCLSAQGKHEAAKDQLTERVKQVAAADYDIAYWLASAYLLQGNEEDAFRWFETAISLGNENYKWFLSDSNWSGMHEDQRFKDLLARVQPPAQEQRQSA